MLKKYGQYIVGGALAAIGGLQAADVTTIVPQGYDGIFMAACGLAVAILHKLKSATAAA